MSFAFSPVALSYEASLRGVVPPEAGAPFSFAQIGVDDVAHFLGLAASNPQGRFYALVSSGLAEAQAQALTRGVDNAVFLTDPAALPTGLAYLCCEQLAVFDEATREETFDLASKTLAPGGLLGMKYAAFADQKDSLRFLIEAYAPELSKKEALAFLTDLRALGEAYFATDKEACAALDQALAAKDAHSFFAPYLEKKTETRSGAFAAMAGLLPRGFAFAGDADVGANYLELTVPVPAQKPLLKRQDTLFYEAMKDFVLQRAARHDVWVKLPAAQTADQPALVNPFTFGITMPREQIPASVPTNGKPIDLTSPLFAKLIDVMSLLPMGVGDFLHHPAGQGFAPAQVVENVRILVALGIARPMRGRFEGLTRTQTAQPLFVTGFNAAYKERAVTETSVPLASKIIGDVWRLPVREALVLQALGRVGLANVSGSLMPEMERLAKENPALAACVTDAAVPSEEVVHALVTDVIQKNMGKWFAYGLLAA